jgi:hypothetical protein
MKRFHTIAKIAAGLALAVLTPASAVEAQTPPPPLPNPILYLTGIEYYTTSAGPFVRYRYDVFNKSSYPAAMFAAAPSLPPCGNNANSSRTWVDFFNGRTNQRLQGFCALGSPGNLDGIWFAMPEGTVPPSYIYIEMTDRQTGTRYRSNLADTVM